MNTTSQNLKAGKGLGITSLVIGIITFIWAIIPVVGALAFLIALPGLILGIIGFIVANKKNNPKKGIIITGIIICLLANSISGYWIYLNRKAANAITHELESVK